MCVRIRKSGIVSFCQVDGDVQRKCEANAERAAVFLENVLEAWAGGSHKYFLSLDGYVEGTQVHEDLYGTCLLWRHGDWENRRLVITTSMSCRRKKNFGEDLEERAKELKLCSWTLEEYQEAFKYDLLYESVVDVMGLGGDSKEGSRRHEPWEQEYESRAREVESKYQIVGGSCRYMFESTREEAMQDLSDAIDFVSDFQTLRNLGIGDRADQFVERLHGKYRTRGKLYWGLISKFVATELDQKHGESFVREVEALSGMTENPTLREVLFQMLFFARTAKEPGLHVTTPSQKSIKWGVFTIKTFDPTQVYDASEQRRERVCLKPLRWNQGGYDAVMLDWRRKSVRFVQGTMRETHDLKLRFFAECLDSLRIKEGSPWTVDIVFVVPTDNIGKFSVRTVENKDMLSRYGWPHGKEESQVNVVGMDPKSCG